MSGLLTPRPGLSSVPLLVMFSTDRLSEQSAQLLGSTTEARGWGHWVLGVGHGLRLPIQQTHWLPAEPRQECLPVQMGGLHSSSIAGSSMPRNGPGTVVKLLWWPRGTPVLFSIKVVDRKGFQGLSWADRGRVEEAVWAGRKLNTLYGSWVCFYAVC